jgi:predicted CXXCH cytochrome family protein
MSSVGGPLAYGATGGDHNEAGYDTSAHGTGTIDPNNSNPGIGCEVCHNKHASAADKLIDYRSSNTTDADLYAGTNLCDQCHKSGSTETSVAAGYSAPFAWNDRDVQVEFARASAHPTQTATSGASTTCINCHNVHMTEEGSGSWVTSRVADPTNTKNVPASFTEFCLGCHTSTYPTSAIGTDTLVPYDVGFTTVTAPYFPGWDKTEAGFEATASGHYTTSGTKALCENCHDPHGSDFERLTAWTRPSTASTLNAGSRANTSTTLSREENLCYQCHGNGTTGKQAPGAKDVATAMSLSYAHPVDDYSGRHSDVETAGALGGTNRHAECVDCHDPHVTRKEGGTALHTEGSSTVGAAVYGAYGAKPTWIATNWAAPTSYAAERLSDDDTDYEAYLCFKCHSSNTAQPTGQTDIALEFNPSNYSAHNVTARSAGVKTSFAVKPIGGSSTQTVSWAFPTQGVFRTGWDKDSMMTCTSCHTNSTANAKGPHGSSAEWLIDPAYSRDYHTVGLWQSGTYGMGYNSGSSTYDATDVICAKCHDLNGSGSAWSNTGHTRSAHFVSHRDVKYCVNCHIKIPHGWKRPRLLGYNTDDSAYATTNNGGGSYPLNQIAVANHTLSGGQAQWACSDCKTTAGKHTSALTSPWP